MTSRGLPSGIQACHAHTQHDTAMRGARTMYPSPRPNPCLDVGVPAQELAALPHGVVICVPWHLLLRLEPCRQALGILPLVEWPEGAHVRDEQHGEVPPLPLPQVQCAFHQLLVLAPVWEAEEEGQVAAAHPAARHPFVGLVAATGQHGVMPRVVVEHLAGMDDVLAGFGRRLPRLHWQDNEVAALHRLRDTTGGAQWVLPFQCLPRADGQGQARDVLGVHDLPGIPQGDAHGGRCAVAIYVVTHRQRQVCARNALSL